MTQTKIATPRINTAADIVFGGSGSIDGGPVLDGTVLPASH